MAPRRGGGGYSGGSSVSIDNQCADYGAFTDTLSQAIIAILGISTFLFFMIFCLYVIRRIRRKSTRYIARFYAFGFSILLILASRVCAIVTNCLSQCGILDDITYFKVINLDEWFYKVGLLLLLFVILIPATLVLLCVAGTDSGMRRFVKIVHVVGLIIVCVLMLARLGIFSYYTSNYDRLVNNSYYSNSGNSYYDLSDYVMLVQTDLRLYAATMFIYFALVVYAVFNMMTAVFKMANSGSLKVLVPLLFISVGGLALSEFAEAVVNILENVDLGTYDRSNGSIIASSAVNHILQVLSYLVVLYIAGSVAVSAYDPSSPNGGHVTQASYAKENSAANAPEYAGVQYQNVRYQNDVPQHYAQGQGYPQGQYMPPNAQPYGGYRQ